MRLIGRAAALACKIDWRRRDNLLRLALFLAVVVAEISEVELTVSGEHRSV